MLIKVKFLLVWTLLFSETVAYNTILLSKQYKSIKYDQEDQPIPYTDSCSRTRVKVQLLLITDKLNMFDTNSV